MAKSGNTFNDRFPYFGIFLVIAVTISIPLTVWSLNRVPTNTGSEASSMYPTPTPSNRIGTPTPTGYSTCSSRGGTCTSNLNCRAKYGVQIQGTSSCAYPTVCCRF